MLTPSVLAWVIGQVFLTGGTRPHPVRRIVAMLALLFVRETRDLKLQDLDQSEAEPAPIR